MRYAWVPMPHDEEILFFPNGNVNIRVLEDLLGDAHNTKPTDKLTVLRRFRVHDVDFPEYEERPEIMTVAKLKELYRNQTGQEFVPQEKRILHHKMYAIFVVKSRRTGQFSDYLVDIGS